MSQATLLDESLKASAHASVPRTAARPAEPATHYLHLAAFPCHRCKGPVVSGWIGRREDGITREIPLTPVGAICLACGLRPEAPVNAVAVNPDGAILIRPLRWEWIPEAVPPQNQNGGDLLSVELSQDADPHADLAASEKVGNQ